jgi:hypothetical protein
MRVACVAIASLPAACQPTTVAPAAVARPAATPAVAAAPVAAATPAAGTGGIGGRRSHPSETLPPMRVCAFGLADATPYCVRTGAHQAQYRLDGLPPGDSLVLAFPQEAGALPGGYTGCVDDRSADCRDHDLQPIIVAAGRTTPDIHPADHYAEAADWPQEPAQ